MSVDSELKNWSWTLYLGPDIKGSEQDSKKKYKYNYIIEGAV